MSKILFLKEFIQKQKEVGSLFPSSKKLALSMIEPIQLDKPLKILEVGAGTGAITDYLISKIRMQDELHIVELNNNLYQLLLEKYKNIKNIFIYNENIINIHFDFNFDYIVSSLPFNSFDYLLTINILDKYKKIMNENGSLIFFEYIGMSHLKSFKKNSFHHIKKQKINKSIKNQKIVLNNFPPAKVTTLRYD